VNHLRVNVEHRLPREALLADLADHIAGRRGMANFGKD
jgi:hypothetical protein